MEATEGELAARGSEACRSMARRLGAARRAFTDAVDFVAGQTKASPNAVFAGSVPYLMLAGTAVAGWQMARSLVAAEEQMADDPEFMKAKIATARFYADHILVRCGALRDSIVEGAESVTQLPLEAF
jgi:3-(methylthio)propanoyl-CoA dehydrogenase